MAYRNTVKEPKANAGIDLMRKRYATACDYWNPKFDLCRDDIKFVTVPGCQWDDKLRSRRGERPLYEFPKLEQHCQTVINEMRQSRPQGKVRGLEETDKGLAEIMQGIARNIESVSNADIAHDVAFAPAVQGGFGVFRICTDYANDDDFDTDIFIDPIRNPFGVKFDPAAIKIDRRDGEYAFVEETMSKEAFERAYPKADASGAELPGDEFHRWVQDRNQVMVCEYYYKEFITRTLLAIQKPAPQGTALNMAAPQLPPPEIVWADDPGMDEETLAANGIQIVKRRTVKTHKVYCRLTNGSEWLTEPEEVPSKFIPLIPVWGNLALIDGADHFKGMVRSNKDSQRLHNVHRTAAIEAVAKAPKAPYVGKLSWIKGFDRMWQRANAEDFAYLPIAEDADGVPQRSQQAEVPAALIQMAQMDNEDIKAGTGQYNPSIGAPSGQASGRALQTQKIQGQTATFNYIDNLVYAIRFQYEILVDMIPRVYDTQRVVRLLGEDGASKWKTLYEEVIDPRTGQRHVINDISKGKYDTTVTVGPSYATQRLEAADAFSTLVGQIGPVIPQIAPVLAFAALNNLDFPGADEISEIVRTTLVKAGALPPKDGDEKPEAQQPNPMQNPQFIAALEKIGSEIRRNNAAAAKDEATAQTILPTAQADIAKTEAETGSTRIGTVGQIGGMLPAPQFPAQPMPLPGVAPYAP